MSNSQTGEAIASIQDAPHHIAFCIDGPYYRSMGATIASILEHNSGMAFVFHVLAFSISEQQRKHLAEIESKPNVRVTLHLVDKSQLSQFSAMLERSYYSLSTFTRLVLPTLLKDVSDRVLYLDADILCLGNIEALLSENLDDTVALVVSDVGWTSSTGQSEGRYLTLGLDNPCYFNAGVMYINIPEWEAADISNAAIKVLVERGDELIFNDQDALNIVLDGRVRYVDKMWNYIYSMIRDLKAGQSDMALPADAKLVHFAGAIKPWHDWSEHAARELYRHYHAQSPWRNEPLDAQPTNYKGMRIYSRFLCKRRRYAAGLYWMLKYLPHSISKKLSS